MIDSPQTPPDDRPPAARLIDRRLLSYDSEARVATLSFLARPEFTNRHGGVQGGLLSAMLDAAAGQTLHAGLEPGFTAVTLRLDTTFVRPAPIGPLHGVGRLISRDERNARVAAELTTPEGVLVARATVDLRIVKSRTNR